MIKELTTAAFAFAATAATAQVNLTSNTAGAGTTAGLSAAGLVEYAAEAGVANIQLKDGQTGTNYIQALGEGKIDIANGPYILPFMLSRAVGPYANLDKETGAQLGANIQLLYPYTLSIFTMYAYDSKGIDGWNDVEGRKILNGPPRGAATTNSRALLQLFAGLKPDENYEPVTANWNQLASLMIDGTADVAVIPVQFPGPRITQIGAAGSMTMFSLPKDVFESDGAQNLLNKPGSASFTAPIADIQAAIGDGWTIVSEDDTFRGMSVVGGDFVQASMDEELAYQLTKAHLDNLDNLVGKAPFMATLNFGIIDPAVSGLCGLNPIKLHPGAARAWADAGFDVPECALP